MLVFLAGFRKSWIPAIFFGFVSRLFLPPGNVTAALPADSNFFFVGKSWNFWDHVPTRIFSGGTFSPFSLSHYYSGHGNNMNRKFIRAIGFRNSLQIKVVRSQIHIYLCMLSPFNNEHVSHISYMYILQVKLTLLYLFLTTLFSLYVPMLSNMYLQQMIMQNSNFTILLICFNPLIYSQNKHHGSKEANSSAHESHTQWEKQGISDIQNNRSKIPNLEFGK